MAGCGTTVGAVAVAGGRADAGIVMCWTGTGVVDRGQQSARCAGGVVHRRRDGAGRSRWNDANVLALGLRLTSETVAVEVADAFLAAAADAVRGRHDRRWSKASGTAERARRARQRRRALALGGGQ